MGINKIIKMGRISIKEWNNNTQLSPYKLSQSTVQKKFKINI